MTEDQRGAIVGVLILVGLFAVAVFAWFVFGWLMG